MIYPGERIPRKIFTMTMLSFYICNLITYKPRSFLYETICAHSTRAV